MINLQCMFLLFCAVSLSNSDLSLENEQKHGWKFDPDQGLDTLQIIRRHGYSAEAHIVQTADGYLLTVHRIPGSKDGKRGGQPVLLQHGLGSSSADFLVEGNASLAFLLADVGYDVWIGNARGNHYSIGHVSLPLDSLRFWNFSFHEMGIYDLPAVVQFISNATGKPGELLYVGHSMGTTMFYVFASLRPQIAKMVKLMVSLAPAAYLTHIRSPIKYLTPFADQFEWIAKHMGIKQFLPSNQLTKFLARECESQNGNTYRLCENLIFILFGVDKAQYNPDAINVILGHDPAGTSTKALLHYVHEVKNGGEFQQYDYGPDGNMAQYGTKTPPSYNLTNIKVPIYLMYGANDYLTSPIDVVRLSKQLKNLVGLYLVPIKEFNHGDFLYGKDAPKVVYEPLVQVLRKYPEDMISVKLILG